MSKPLNTRYRDILTLINQFSDSYLDEAYKAYAENVLNDLQQHPKVKLDRSTAPQWAASIIYLVVRLNFLFDDPLMSPDVICDFFKTNKNTTGNKATEIQKHCNIYPGKEGYVSPDLVEMFTYYETEEGLIIPKSMYDNLVARNNRRTVNEKKSIRERRALEKERELQAFREKIEKKRKDKDQLGLFEDEH